MMNLKKNNKLVKNNKKDPPKKPTKADVNEMNELIIKKGTSINKELLKIILTFKCRLQC